jgi:hypothetical protein
MGNTCEPNNAALRVAFAQQDINLRVLGGFARRRLEQPLVAVCRALVLELALLLPLQQIAPGRLAELAQLG